VHSRHIYSKLYIKDQKNTVPNHFKHANKKTPDNQPAHGYLKVKLIKFLQSLTKTSQQTFSPFYNVYIFFYSTHHSKLCKLIHNRRYEIAGNF